MRNITLVLCVTALGALSSTANAEKDNRHSVLKKLEMRSVQDELMNVHPITGSIVIPAEQYELAQVNAGDPVIDKTKSQYDQFYDQAVAQLKSNYNPAVYGQYSLPADIATMRVGKVKRGVMSRFGLFEEKDKLSVYLFQHKAAMRLYGLYEQRLIAWHKGRAPLGVTVEQAINREALHKFLETELTSDSTTVDMIRYLDNRLSSRDADLIRSWLIRNQDVSATMTVIDILANGMAQQKIDSLYLQ